MVHNLIDYQTIYNSQLFTTTVSDISTKVTCSGAYQPISIDLSDIIEINTFKLLTLLAESVEKKHRVARMKIGLLEPSKATEKIFEVNK